MLDRRTATTKSAEELIYVAERSSANNYHPLPVVLTRGEGVWVWDVDGRRYLDCLAAYSALNQGHCHPHIVAALRNQAECLTLTSRAFHNDRMGDFLSKLCNLVGYDKALPMNTGTEAVETAIKAVRKWGYRIKGVDSDRAEIITANNNFHGRSTTIVGFSTEDQYREDFGPFTPGFPIVPYGDLPALEATINENTVGFLVEPLQGEGGVVVPPDGYMAGAADLCRRHNVALIADEVQTGLGRTGKLLASEWDGIRPDIVILGKALGGGVYPVSAVLADDEIMGLFSPGDHGSTFGGNPLAAAVGEAALDVIIEEDLTRRAATLGEWFMERLRSIDSPHIQEVRGRGLMIGVVIRESSGTARVFCQALMERGILAKETHHQVIRFAPPLVIERSTLVDVMPDIEAVLVEA